MNTSKDTLTLLRLPFSLLLMPVYLFGMSQCENIDWQNSLIIFVVMHLLVYPSSNAYNSYIDQDESSIGGLKNPPKAGKQVFNVSVIMDAVSLIISFAADYRVALMIFGYIVMSRAYSSKLVRIKKYAIASYVVVMIFQGALVYAISQTAAGYFDLKQSALALYASTFMIAGVYPLTQIYQHKEDKENGDNTISLRLGIKGTFTLSFVMFAVAALFMLMHFINTDHVQHFYLYLLFMAPSAAFLMWWRKMSLIAPLMANFKNTMIMNVLSAISMNLYFLLLIYFNHLQ